MHAEGLLTETGHRRYGMHDLIRRYTRDLATADTPADADRQQALGRLLDYYQHTAALAETRLAQVAHPGSVPATPAGFEIPELANVGQALAWARAERASLFACLDLAAHTGQHDRVVALTAGLAALLRRDGPRAEMVTRHAAAVAAARHQDDRLGEANALINLGSARLATADNPGAAGSYEQALGIYRETGDPLGQAEVRNEQGTLHRIHGDLTQAEGCHQQALDLARAIGSPLEEARAMAGLGRCTMAASHATRAQALLRQAQQIFQRIGAAEARDVLTELDALTAQDPQAEPGIA